MRITVVVYASYLMSGGETAGRTAKKPQKT